MTVPTRDGDLYLNNIIIQAGGVLFNVPREILAGSPVIESMFEMPQTGEPDGTSDAHPLVIDIKADDFRHFVRAATCHFMGGTASLGAAEWTAVLRLADMLAVDGLRHVAATQLDGLLTAADAALRLQLAHDFALEQWILPAVHDLATRIAPLGEADIAALHPRHLARVLEVREVNLAVARGAGAAVSYRGILPILAPRAPHPLSAEAKAAAERLFGRAVACVQPLARRNRELRIEVI